MFSGVVYCIMMILRLFEPDMDKIKRVAVDASSMNHPDYRKGTVAGALASVLAGMSDDEVVTVHKCLDSFNEVVSVKKIRDKLVYITNNHEDIKLHGYRFMTVLGQDGLKIKKVKTNGR